MNSKSILTFLAVCLVAFLSTQVDAQASSVVVSSVVQTTVVAVSPSASAIASASASVASASVASASASASATAVNSPSPTSNFTNSTLLTGAQNDIRVLQYLIVLENLDVKFWNNSLSQFGVTDFIDAGFNETIYEYLTQIYQHELIHLSALTSWLGNRNVTAYPPCDYSFNITSIQDLLDSAMTLQNLMVYAYNGALNLLSNATLQEQVATIATVEGRQAAFLNVLNLQNPFPQGFDLALPPSNVTQLIAPIQVCSFELLLPVSRNRTLDVSICPTLPSSAVPSGTGTPATIVVPIISGSAAPTSSHHATDYRGTSAGVSLQPMLSASFLTAVVLALARML